jgi:hypothetical protein
MESSESYLTRRSHQTSSEGFQGTEANACEKSSPTACISQQLESASLFWQHWELSTSWPSANVTQFMRLNHGRLQVQGFETQSRPLTATITPRILGMLSESTRPSFDRNSSAGRKHCKLNAAASAARSSSPDRKNTSTDISVNPGYPSHSSQHKDYWES